MPWNDAERRGDDMAYSDFSFDGVKVAFELTTKRDILFSNITPRSLPDWLVHFLSVMEEQALGSEKARSEFIIAPILATLKEQNQNIISVFSGVSLNVSPAEGLSGECDFILASQAPVPTVESPLFAFVEAEKADIDLGWGQCIAQMVGAQRRNAMDKRSIEVIFGCITSGETWQFLRLIGRDVTIDAGRYYINDIPLLLGVLQTCIDTSLASKSSHESSVL